MTKTIVHLDCDGILSDFSEKLLRTVEELTGKKVTKSNFTQWEFIDDIVRLFPHLKIDLKRAAYAQIKQAGWCYDIKPCEGAQEGFRALREVATVHIVTSPWYDYPHWCYERFEWLKDYFHVDPKDVTHCSRKEFIGQEGDLFIDDKPSSVEKWNAVHGMGGYVWNLPYTRATLSELPRVLGWQDIIDLARRA